MAEVIQNDKGFKILKMSSLELTDITGADFCVCDSCNEDLENKEGYYIAVLNQFFCEKCYKDWLNRAKHYAEDDKYEAKNFNFYYQKAKQKKPVTTIDNGRIQEWESREKAINFYILCLASSEGSEQNRYASILNKLVQGLDRCSDKD